MDSTFGQRLKNYRKAKNLTQQELGERIGVSDKTVSRWESDGGYPDVPTLVPLAEALGVSVDDLLNTRRPVRTLSRTDYQSLLSFAFALGGGVLFYLLRLFVPGLLCYLAYLGCLAYGVYLQKYYAYHSRWFLLGETVMNLGVNLTMAGEALALLSAVGMLSGFGSGEAALQWLLLAQSRGWLALALWGLAALTATALTQYLIWRKGFDGKTPDGKNGKKPTWPRGRLRWGKPALRQLLPGLVPLLAGCFWLPGLWQALGQADAAWAIESQRALFQGFLLLLGVLGALPLLKKGLRRRILPEAVMTLLCGAMLGLRVYPWLYAVRSGELFPYVSGAAERYIAVGVGSWGTLALALALAAAWVLLSCLKWQSAEK